MSESLEQMALQSAREFHELYESLAPKFGYETRADTKAFDPASKNGKLMVAVCGEIARRLRAEWDAEKQKPVKYGCHCDIEETVSGQPDECVFDTGDIDDCIYAVKLQKEGKGKTDCSYYRPINFVQPKAEQQKQEPVAWRYRHWNGMYERWDDWHHVAHQPQGSNNATFEKEPLGPIVAAPPQDAQDAKRVVTKLCNHARNEAKRRFDGHNGWLPIDDEDLNVLRKFFSIDAALRGKGE